MRRGIDIDAGCGQLTQGRKAKEERAARRKLAVLGAESKEKEAASPPVAAGPSPSEKPGAAAMAKGAPPSELTVAGGWGG